MGLLVPTSASFPGIVHYLGEYARVVHPANLDARQQYLISGWCPPQAFSQTREPGRDAVHRFPILLPPWAGGIQVAVRAIRTQESGSLSLQLRTEDEAQDEVALSGYLDLSAELDTGAAPDEESDWASVSWAGLAGVWSGSGGLSIAITEVLNEARMVWLWVEAADCALRDVLVRATPSPTAVEG